MIVEGFASKARRRVAIVMEINDWRVLKIKRKMTFQEWHGVEGKDAQKLKLET